MDLYGQSIAAAHVSALIDKKKKKKKKKGRAIVDIKITDPVNTLIRCPSPRELALPKKFPRRHPSRTELRTRWGGPFCVVTCE